MEFLHPYLILKSTPQHYLKNSGRELQQLQYLDIVPNGVLANVQIPHQDDL